MKPLELGISEEVWAHLEWRRIPDPTQAVPVPDLTKLGFNKAQSSAAGFDSLLIPLWWKKKSGEIVKVGYRLRHDNPGKRPKYESPPGKGQFVHGAYGKLRDDPAAWGNRELPILFVEGEKKAAALSSYVPELCIVSSPGVYNQSSARSDIEKQTRWRKRPHEDFSSLDLRSRTVYWVGDRDAIDGSNPDVRKGTDESCQRLAERGAIVFEVYTPGPEKAIDDWIIVKRSEGTEASEITRDIHALIEGATRWKPPPGVAVETPPAHGQGDLFSVVLGPGYDGPQAAKIPNAAEINERGGMSMLRHDGVPVHFADRPIWVTEERQGDDGTELVIASLVHGRVKHCTVARSLLHDPRKLCMNLGKNGFAVVPGRHNETARYLASVIHENEACIPQVDTQPSTGWSHDSERQAFLLGRECVAPQNGKRIELRGLETDPVSAELVDAVRVSGIATRWKEATEEAVRVSSVAALVLAISTAAPLIRGLGWPNVGGLLGDPGGTGKSSLLRIAASVWGSSGPIDSMQPAGMVGRGHGTIAGLSMQFRRLGDLPHLVDEFCPSLIDARQREETDRLLKALFEGRENIRSQRDSSGAIGGHVAPGPVILAGEIGSTDFLKSQGSIRRFLSPRAPYASNVEPSTLAKLARECATHYGHLGKALVQGLVARNESQRVELAVWHRRYLECPELSLLPGADEITRTWARQIATCLAAVEIASELCPDLCPAPTLWKQQILVAWEGLKEEVFEQGGTQADRVWYEVVAWVLQNRAQRLLPSTRYVEDNPRFVRQGEVLSTYVDQRAPPIGKVHNATNEGHIEEVLLEVDILKRELDAFVRTCGHSPAALVPAWGQSGCLITTSSQRKQGKWICTSRFNGGLATVYRLKIGGAKNDAPRATPTPFEKPATEVFTEGTVNAATRQSQANIRGSSVN